MNPKYPNVVVSSNINGNAFVIMGAVSYALRRGGVSNDEVDQFKREAMSGDYNNLLQTVMKWVTFE